MQRSVAEPEALFQQACGVLANRLEVDTETAGQILDRVARREGLSRTELAATVVNSCTQAAYLPRDLYTNGHSYESAA
jgi:ANTAR domain-containing protein